MKNLKNNIMRTTILILLSSIISLFSGYANNCLDEDNNKTDITLVKGDVEDETKHARTPTYIPLVCYYMQGNIYVTALSDLGEIQISITCLETGSFWESINDSKSGTISIPVSSVNGDYMVRIVTANGDIYYGYYTI